MGRVVAIDGPSGAGKSTIAHMLAERLGFDYLDTGALYRAVALGLRRGGLDEDAPEGEIERVLGGFEVEFRQSRTYLNGVDVSEDIRTPEAGHYASVFSARGPVRKALLPIQRRAAEVEDIVAEGRDMGTVVFPDAWGKFFLDATVDARALRRFEQLKAKGMSIDMDTARRDVVVRDERDSSRDLAPLRAAHDAVVIDSSSMSIEEVVNFMIDKLGESKS